jgi:hypothetical protein
MSWYFKDPKTPLMSENTPEQEQRKRQEEEERNNRAKAQRGKLFCIYTITKVHISTKTYRTQPEIG